VLSILNISISSSLQTLYQSWQAHTNLFWPTWLLMLTAAVFSTWHMVHPAPASFAQNEGKETDHGELPRVWPCGAVVSLTLLSLFIAGWIALASAWQEFDYSDNSMFTLFTLKEHNLQVAIWKDEGRFFPLGHQEFNLIRHFTHTAVGYHVFPELELIALAAILLLIDLGLNLAKRVGLVMIALIVPSILVSFNGLIYTERNVVLWLACLIFCIQRFEQTQRTLWAVGAVICAQIMIFYKETGFVLLLCFAVARLVVRCRKENKHWDFEQIKGKNSRLDLCFVLLALGFILYYASQMFPNMHAHYDQEVRLPGADAVVAYLELDWLVWLLVLVTLTRAYLILRRKAQPELLWDGLAIGGIAYFGAYLWLRMYSTYYLAPVDLIAVLYLGRVAATVWRQHGLKTKVFIAALICAVVVQEVSFSCFRMIERENVVRAKAQVAQTVEALYQGMSGAKRLFFPFSTPYRMMEFGAYLNYKGVPVEGAQDEPNRLTGVILAGGSVVKDGRCVVYRSVLCQAASAPSPGDLVIVLPDDDASYAKVRQFRQEGETLLYYQPLPRLPSLLALFMRQLHVASYAFSQKQLPDRWLDASVTLSK
jgi:hypothetical protein